ncbi:MarR family transcriptional regulator [Deinococcus peraridilitoris]|uniref:Sugar-specific transcriptional regulator TrmB n=1 Tax=Deinococcus peraridilitoris (strain DSM 19664 / LMG 22246 / CIP 109416 / KR-200) TaxID=937777 RepID=K9ZYA9_DEIPD|nr:helix-turn-helix domain-containing protein [Deinococcus peraridilitoris]AFZ66581.1 Sugar-specific transcriptional regulator TrmB [Deinococcus peraridilitoris DSM 19664]
MNEVELEHRILEALRTNAPLSAKELSEQLGVRGHDISKVLGLLLTRDLVSAQPRDSQQQASHTNPRVYSLT